MNDTTTFKEFLSLIGERYQVEVSQAMARMIWEALKPFPDNECQRAFNHVLLKCRFYKDLIPDLLEYLQGSEEDQAGEAWLLVEKAIRHVGPWSSVEFPDPAIHSTIESLGGWVSFQDCHEQDLKWIGKDFRQRYKLMSRKEAHPEYLPGQVELDNRARGFLEFIPQPVKVKDEQGRVRFIDPPRSEVKRLEMDHG